MLRNVKSKIFGVVDQVTRKMHKIFKATMSSIKSAVVGSDDGDEKDEKRNGGIVHSFTSNEIVYDFN